MQKVYLKEELEHGKYLGRPLRDLKELADWIPSNEIYLLEKYGAWMEALVRQEIKPVTEDQKRFIKVVNENGAGDAFTSMFFLSLCAKINPILTLKLSIALGCMQLIEYNNKNLLKYDKKFQHFIDKIKIKKYDSKVHRN